ncbi:MAG: hypothetical protein ACW97V_02530 [Promethearchaeota archaeon]|jgi:chromosome segregation ATPase
MGEQEDHEEDEDQISEALSTLGWVEEEEEVEETPKSDEDLREQLEFFKEENKRLIHEMNEKKELIGDKVDLIQNLENKVEELSSQVDNKLDEDQAIQKLYETIENKNDEIELLNSRAEQESNKTQKIIDDQVQKIKELSAQVEDFQSEKSDLVDNKDNQIKELKEQLQYLQDDTIQKSKFQKLEVLTEGKDEIITEKEKTIFALENSLKSANHKTQEIQQQLETFNLVKKDLEKKNERNKELVVEIEELKQKNITNNELVNRLEEKLEEAHKKSGNLTGKFEMELGNLRNLLDGKDNELKSIKEKYEKIDSELLEYRKIEDKILSDIQSIKDENLKFESELEVKNAEIIDLKKKIKLMRRDLLKT